MAIHGDFPGLTVQVLVNDEPLEEYTDEEVEDPPKTVTRYIECQSGAEFAIKTSFTTGFDLMDLNLKTCLDGVLANKKLARKESLFDPAGWIQGSTKWKAGTRWYRSKFSFSRLELIEGCGQPWDVELQKALESIGVITLELFRVTEMRENRNPSGMKCELLNLGKISEKAFKGDARSHQASLSVPEETKAVNTSTALLEKEPFVTFNFKYRSMAALKSLGLLPRTPSPTPAPNLPASSTQSTPISLHATPVPRPNSSTPTPRPGAILINPIPSPQQTSVPPSSSGQDGLTTEEIIAMIKIYRGHDNGLVGQTRKSLLGLLKYYEAKDDESTPVKSEIAMNEGSGRRIKREPDDNVGIRGNEKRRKKEVIVLDD